MKLKKSLTGIEFESDLPEQAYGDVKKQFTKDEKDVLGVAANYRGSSTEEIAKISKKSPAFVEKTMTKAAKHGGAKKKNGKWFTEPKFILAVVGVGLILILATIFGGGITGAKAQMGDVGEGAMPLQQSPLTSALAVRDLKAGRGILFSPLQQSPFSAPATVGEVGEKGLVQQFSPFSPIRQAEIGQIWAGEGAIVSPEIQQRGGQILASSKDFGDVYQSGDQLLILGDESTAIQQQMRISQQGGQVGLINVTDVKQTETYTGLSAEEKAILSKYL